MEILSQEGVIRIIFVLFWKLENKIGNYSNFSVVIKIIAMGRWERKGKAKILGLGFFVSFLEYFGMQNGEIQIENIYIYIYIISLYSIYIQL